MYCPDIFKDNSNVKEKVITYLSVHGFKFLDIGTATRIICPDKFTTFHYCADTQILRYLFNAKGQKIYNVAPIKVEGFMEAICSHVLPNVGKGYLVYNVCKIPYLLYEQKL